MTACRAQQDCPVFSRWHGNWSPEVERSNNTRLLMVNRCSPLVKIHFSSSPAANDFRGWRMTSRSSQKMQKAYAAAITNFIRLSSKVAARISMGNVQVREEFSERLNIAMELKKRLGSTLGAFKCGDESREE